jgi:hypothetical protein
VSSSLFVVVDFFLKNKIKRKNYEIKKDGYLDFNG